MCGFIGCIGLSGSPERLNRGLPWLARRGPDSQKLWTSLDGVAGILFARLAIVDKDPRSHQPMSDAASGITVGMVGEIYNHRELRALLSDRSFRTKSDTEIVLAAYASRGTGGLDLLKGMYALVIVDERNGRIILARDAVGKKPLFLAHWASGVYFGSSLLPLAAVHGGPVALNAAAVSHYWERSYVSAGTTCLSGAMPVLPGQVVELDWSGSVVSKTRCAPKASLLYAGEDVREATENVRSLLTTAVRRRLQDNPSPVSLLSGGIDSTVVTEAAAREGPLENLQTLSLAALIPWTKDERYARYAARRLDLPIRMMRPDLRRLRSSVFGALDLQDQPLGMPSFFLLERLVRVCSDVGRILLSGDGGDEVFLGYDRVGRWKRTEDMTRRIASLIACGPELPDWMSDWARKVTTDTLVGHMFDKADRASAEQGVELRCPLLDWDLMAYARSLPFEILTHGHVSKSLLKRQLEGWPEWFLTRPKIGFAYSLRWLWGLSGFSGIRQAVDDPTMAQFERYLPPALKKKPSKWSFGAIFSHFNEVWRLMAWSRFLARLEGARRGTP